LKRFVEYGKFEGFEKFAKLFKQRLYFRFQFLRFHCHLMVRDHIALFVNEKLVEVPPYLLHILLFFQPFIQRLNIVAVHLYLLKLRETDVVLARAELMYIVIGARSLLHKLVARKIKYFEALVFVFLIERLQTFILRSESAAGGSVDYQKNFALVFRESDRPVVAVFDREIIDSGLSGEHCGTKECNAE